MTGMAPVCTWSPRQMVSPLKWRVVMKLMRDRTGLTPLKDKSWFVNFSCMGLDIVDVKMFYNWTPSSDLLQNKNCIYCHLLENRLKKVLLHNHSNENEFILHLDELMVLHQDSWEKFVCSISMTLDYCHNKSIQFICMQHPPTMIRNSRVVGKSLRT